MAQRAFRAEPDPGYFERFMFKVVEGLESLVELGYRLSGRTNEYLYSKPGFPNALNSDEERKPGYGK